MICNQPNVRSAEKGAEKEPVRDEVIRCLTGTDTETAQKVLGLANESIAAATRWIDRECPGRIDDHLRHQLSIALAIAHSETGDVHKWVDEPSKLHGCCPSSLINAGKLQALSAPMVRKHLLATGRYTEQDTKAAAIHPYADARMAWERH